MLLELRSKKGGSAFGDKFNFKKFKSLENTNMLNAYAESFLEKLGQGSSRAAYVLSNRYVLKIAINQKGIAQNKAELKIASDSQTKEFIANVHTNDDDLKWIVLDIVRPITQEDEFQKLTGDLWEDYVYFLKMFMKRPDLKKHYNDEGTSFAKKVSEIASKHNLLLGDLIEIDHWGKTPDGRVVLLDYGFTESVWTDHYKNQPDQNASTEPATKK